MNVLLKLMIKVINSKLDLK